MSAAHTGDDIDTHCIGPQWLQRYEHFFGSAATCLEAMLRAAPWVLSVRALPEAYVPVLKLDIKGVDIDLTYAQLPMAEVPRDLDLQDNRLLAGMDEKSILSINGCRVTDKLLQLVSGRCRCLGPFQDALRLLKVSAVQVAWHA
jgi:poly(A) polymerase